MENKNSFYAYLFSCFAIFALVYYPAFFIPFHSDDYLYFLQGLSLEEHLKHYLNWSGRFITDYISSLCLNLLSKPIYMALNSLVLLVILICISLIPSIIAKEKFINSKSTVLLWTSFFLYWLCNPNLGQTTFWLVGSANYLWTLMWASLYIIYLLNLVHNEIKLTTAKTFCLIVLAFFAGLSNEATGVSMVFFTFILFFIYKNQRKTLIIAFIATLSGFLFLYFTPGNFKRLEDPIFTNWRNSTFSEKIISHIFNRIPNGISGFWLAFCTIILSLFSLQILENREKKEKFWLFAFLFFVMAVFSFVVFVVSPVFMARSQNTFNFFIILSASFCIYEVLSLQDKKKILFIGFLFLVFMPYFALSWARFTYAVKQTSIQADIREEIILKAKNQGESEAKIPDWYFTKLIKDNDKFDLYRSLDMPHYYGIEKITWLPVKFNYAIIKTQKPILSQNLADNLKLNLFYDNAPRLFRNNKNLVFEFDKNILNIAKQGDNILYIYPFINDNEFLNAHTQINNFTQIGEKIYYVINLENFDIEKFKKINFGFYNSVSEKASAQFSINLKEPK